VTWHPGEHVILRGADWRVLRSTAHADCTALDLVAAEPPPIARTVLLPFDRPRRAPARRLAVVSEKEWSEQVASAISHSYPYGGLRFVPSSIDLLAYQLEPALAIFRHGSTRVLVGDDVGLGKTVEAGVIVREVMGRALEARTLIVVPAALKVQWSQELAARFALTAVDVTPAWLRTISRELPPGVNPWSIPGIYLASIDFVKRPEVLAALESVRWDLLVVDEVHGATPGSDRLGAIDALGCRASAVILLSATPHSGDRAQFDALCRIGAGPDPSPLLCFRRSRLVVSSIAQPPVRSRVLTVTPTADEREMHRRLERYTSRLWEAGQRGDDRNPALLATVFRKRALSSAGALASSLVRRLAAMQPHTRVETQPWLPLSAEEREEDEERGDGAETVVGGTGLEDEEGERKAIEHCLAAAEAASQSESKARRLVRLLTRLREPAIVFTEYRDTALRLRARIAALGRPVLLLHGGLTAEDRTTVVAEFVRGDAVLVATDAASEGLNLHHRCRLIVHYELPWSPARLHQRCGRVNRIGQRRRVHEIALVAADTAEQLVLHPLIRRAVQSSAFLSSSMARQLPEALVAARVLDGKGLTAIEVTDDVAIPTHHFSTLDLRDEACAEAARLRTLRHLGERGSSSATPLIPLRAAVRRTDTQLIVLLAVSFRTTSGEMLEEALLPIAVSFAGRRWRRSRSALRQQVARALEQLEPHLGSIADTFARSRAAAITARHAGNVAARISRLRALSSSPASSPKPMVQPGLFGRAALRAGRSPATATLLDEPPPTRDDEERVVWQRKVVAVRCGGLP
jgi:superfamily II DNA or RNA helicase